MRPTNYCHVKYFSLVFFLFYRVMEWAVFPLAAVLIWLPSAINEIQTVAVLNMCLWVFNVFHQHSNNTTDNHINTAVWIAHIEFTKTEKECVEKKLKFEDEDILKKYLHFIIKSPKHNFMYLWFTIFSWFFAYLYDKLELSFTFFSICYPFKMGHIQVKSKWTFLKLSIYDKNNIQNHNFGFG